MPAQVKDLVLDAGDHRKLAGRWCAAKLVAPDATVVRRRGDELEWDVLADPAGNDLCVFQPR